MPASPQQRERRAPDGGNKAASLDSRRFVSKSAEILARPGDLVAWWISVGDRGLPHDAAHERAPRRDRAWAAEFSGQQFLNHEDPSPLAVATGLADCRWSGGGERPPRSLIWINRPSLVSCRAAG